MRKVLDELLHEQKEATQIYCDNTSAIALSKNHVFHKQRKHIDTRYHYIQELMNDEVISIQFCRSEDQFADIFTKALGNELFKIHRKNLGVCLM